MLYILLISWLVVISPSFTVARNLPRHDLNQVAMEEIRNILSHHRPIKSPLDLYHPHEVKNWGLQLPLGQVTGLATDRDGRLYIFHRGMREWHSRSFNWTHHFMDKGPIEESTIMVVNPETGEVEDEWGKSFFYLPHGIHVDEKNNVWLTDVAMHQVFMFEPRAKTPTLSLGEKLVPGSDQSHFCQPTSVAVGSSGEIFVADGYCNSRIVKFDKDGSYVGQFGPEGISAAVGGLSVPHGLALDQKSDILCIADRENKRVICIRAGLKDPKDFGEPITALQTPSKERIFDLTFIEGGLMGIGGSEEEGVSMGFTADGETGQIVDEWTSYQGFRNPHAIAVSPDQSSVYIGELSPNRVWKFQTEQLRY